MDTSIPAGTRIVGIHENTGRTQVSYLSNGVGTGIIIYVPMGGDGCMLLHLSACAHTKFLKTLFLRILMY